MNYDPSPSFVNGMATRWAGAEPYKRGTGDADFDAGWQAMDEKLANPQRGAQGAEALVWAEVGDKAWQHVLTQPYGSGVLLAFRLAQLADLMVEKLRGKQENDISFLDKLGMLAKVGLHFAR